MPVVTHLLAFVAGAVVATLGWHIFHDWFVGK